MEVRKFIVINDTVIFGLVELHSDLIPESYNIKPIGGGMWEYNETKFPNKIFFFGKSHDFGRVSKEVFIKAWQDTYVGARLEKCEVIFSTKEYFSEVLIENNIKPL